MALLLTHVALPFALLFLLLSNLIPGAPLFLGLCRRLENVWKWHSGETVSLAEVLRFVLQRRGRIVTTWIRMLIQRGAIAYLSGFWIWFIFQLLTRSAAFTWGTTLGSIVSAERVSRAASWISAPWRWAFAGPTEQQIAATQSWYGEALPVVKAGWEAWAVFLMLAVLVYAILPRVIVLITEGMRLRWLLGREDFAALRFERLLGSMLVPAGLESDSPDPSELRQETFAAVHMPGKVRKKRATDVGLILGLESLVAGRETDLMAKLLEKFQLAEARWVRLGESAEGQDQLRARIQSVITDWLPLDHQDRILHLVDSGQNPKQSYLRRLSLVRELTGPQAGIVFVLVGRNRNSLQEREKIWLKSIRKWRDYNTDVALLPLEQINGAEPTQPEATQS
jgi:hypothetical protein